jgi:hypothetical protein
MKKDRFYYPKDFNEKIKEHLESDSKEEVKLGIMMLLRENGFRSGMTLWIEDEETFHPIPLLFLHAKVDLTKHGSVERPAIDLMCLDVLKVWTDGSELQEIGGVTAQTLVGGTAMVQFTYAEVLASGIVRMQNRLLDYERTVGSFSESVKALEKQLAKARWQRKIHTENVKTCRTRLERLRSDPSGKESLEYLASIQRKLLSQIMIIDEEEGTD